MILDEKIDSLFSLTVTRSEESFIVLKLEKDKFLIVDSHLPSHGTVCEIGLLNYILLAGLVVGPLHWGIIEVQNESSPSF